MEPVEREILAVLREHLAAYDKPQMRDEKRWRGMTAREIRAAIFRRNRSTVPSTTFIVQCVVKLENEGKVRVNGTGRSIHWEAVPISEVLESKK